MRGKVAKEIRKFAVLNGIDYKELKKAYKKAIRGIYA